MATYFVSPSGNDSNNGLGPDASNPTNKPWLTLGKLLGAAGMASGDTAYVCPGTYRESVTMALTVPTAETAVYGDPWNAQGFCDAGGNRITPGDVIWTCYTTNDKTAPGSPTVLTYSSRNFMRFENITFVGSITASTVKECIWRRCTFIAAANVTYPLILTVGSSIGNCTIDKCQFIGARTSLNCILGRVSGADYDANIQITSCLFTSNHWTVISVGSTGAGANFGGGVDVLNCTFYVDSSAITVADASISTSIPCTIYNSVIYNGPSGDHAFKANASGQITENYNLLYCTNARSNVSTGANSVGGGTPHVYAKLFEYGQAQLWGRQPRPAFSPTKDSPLLGFGNQAGAPSDDLLGAPRPSGPGPTWANALPAVGAFERTNFSQPEQTVSLTGAAIKLVGPGAQDLRLPLELGPFTVRVSGRFDSTYAGTKPQLKLVDGTETGVADVTATMTASADTWEELSVSGQVVRRGAVTVRLQSSSTAGGGIATFDRLAVT